MKNNELIIYSLLSSIEEINLQEIWKNNNISIDEKKEVYFSKVIDKARNLVSSERVFTSKVASIFNIIDNSNPKDYYYPFAISTIDESNGFPRVSNPTQNNYEEYTKEFVDEVHHLSNKELEIESYVNSLYYLCKKYLWCVGNDTPLSLFEFIKLQTSFAVCLDKLDDENKEFPFLLTCIDISGIQNFVYNIHSSKAAKSIKGRSFYLQLLVDTLINYIINFEGVEVSLSNVVYDSGGKAYLILPNTEECINSLKQIENTIIKNSFDTFQESIYVCMDFVKFNLKLTRKDTEVETDELDENGKSIKSLSGLWKIVSEKTAKKKQGKFKSLFYNNYLKLFKGNGLEEDYNGKGMTACAVTGIPVAKKAENEISENIYVLPVVKQQYELGEKLKNTATYYETTQVSKKDLSKPNKWLQPLQLGVFHQVREYSELNYISTLKIINPTINGKKPIDFSLSKYSSLGFTYYGGNQQATNKDKDRSVKDFEELAKPSEDKEFRKIAVVRMDVDNLSKIFIDGFKEENKTFALYSTLSAQLDWFFSGYLNTIRNQEKYNEWINIIYSGGDDVFAVGRWDKIIEFSAEVRKKFQEFVGNRIDISLSTGIAIVSPKFPISKTAELAGEALDKAKEYKREGKKSKDEADKNAIHLLDMTVSWSKEFDFVINLKEIFIDLLDKGIMSKGFIYKLFIYQEMKNKGIKDWWWQSLYHLTRFKENANKKKQKNSEDLIDSIKIAIVTGNFILKDTTFEDISLKVSRERMLDLICLSAKLADYYTR